MLVQPPLLPGIPPSEDLTSHLLTRLHALEVVCTTMLGLLTSSDKSVEINDKVEKMLDEVSSSTPNDSDSLSREPRDETAVETEIAIKTLLFHICENIQFFNDHPQS